MDQPPTRESSALLLTDFVLFSQEHGSLSLLQDDHLFIDILATISQREHSGQSLQPTIKIRRFELLEKEAQSGRILWKTNDSIELPLDVQHINVSVSLENSKYAVQKLGYIEQDSGNIWDIALNTEGTCVRNLVGDFGSTSGYMLLYSFLVIPRNEFVSLKEKGKTKHAVLEERERQIDAWLRHEHDKTTRFEKLGSLFYQRFERIRDTCDISMAIAYFSEMARLIPDGHPNKPTLLNNLGSSLLSRFERLGDLNDVNKFIMMVEDAVRLTPDGHPDKPSRLNNLGSSLARRFKHLGDLNDINKSIIMFEDAVRLTPDGHPDKPALLSNLGNSLLTRFEKLGNCNDQIHCMNYCSSAANSLTGAPISKFRASLSWARVAAQLEDPSLLTAYRTALTLLPQLAWIGLPVKDRQFYLKEASTLVRHAAVAAIENDDPTTAVEWLERGRSVIWGQILHLRQPITQLQTSHPKFAKKLLFLSSTLEGATVPQQLSSTGSSKLENPPDYHSVAHEREQLIDIYIKHSKKASMDSKKTNETVIR